MSENLKLLELIAPDIITDLTRRYKVLRQIAWSEPIGRRALAQRLNISERTLRTESDYLKSLALIDSSKSGMTLTQKGRVTQQKLEVLMDELTGMKELEQNLRKLFGNKRCIVLPGDSDEEKKVLEDFGEILVQCLDEQLPEGENILAIMGGTTMAALAENFMNLETSNRHNLFVPARGGIGEALNIQANSVSAKMAALSHGEHHALYVPEQVSPQTYDLLIQEPAIQEVLTLIETSNCVIHSIGRALYMAARRKMNDQEILMLKQKGAVAESFGYFFNAQGQIVYKIPRIGLQLKQLKKIPLVFAIAGGKSKAKAIVAYMQNAPKQTCLIIDEACANEILRGATL
ncbi:MAG: sugar-binding domain-containing protein [Streptococcaceae bacterium]|jgi:central glycolytic genes regulator|nr:sugar-binding domain-containing protein [Streptococcaceae bacterium]